MNITERILDSCLPWLQNRVIKDAVFGIALIVVELDDGMLGSALLLLEEMHTCSEIYPISREVLHANAAEIARWAVHSDHPLKQALGFAVLNAAANYQIPHDLAIIEARNAVQVLPSDTVGMIGNIHALTATVRASADRLIIFDRGAPGPGIEPEELQPQLLPLCDLVLITGSAFLNNTMETVLSYCSKARETWVIGPSTPLYPLAFSHTQVTHLAGTLWRSECKDDLFRAASLGAMLRDIGSLARKVVVEVKH